MNNHEMEEMINISFEKSKPDMLEMLEAELNISDGHINNNNITSERQKKRNHLMGRISAIAAMLIIFAGGIGIYGHNANGVESVIGLDVNPSIEISVNSKGKVISAESFNEAGDEILKDMNLDGTEFKVAANAIVGSMLTNGYLNEISNSILVSVRTKDSQKGSAINQEISDSINEYLKSRSVSGAIMGQYVEADEALTSFASENGISLGKAKLIMRLAESDSGLSEKALLKLSTQELMQIMSDVDDKTGTIKYGTVDKSQYLSNREVLEKSAAYVNIDTNEMETYSVKLTCDDGKMVYDVKFSTNTMSYDMIMDAAIGTILKYEKKRIKTSSTGNGNIISETKAKSIALKKANIHESDIGDYSIEREHGTYEIEFSCMHMEYEIKIDCKTGDILNFETEYDD